MGEIPQNGIENSYDHFDSLRNQLIVQLNNLIVSLNSLTFNTRFNIDLVELMPSKTMGLLDSLYGSQENNPLNIDYQYLTKDIYDKLYPRINQHNEEYESQEFPNNVINAVSTIESFKGRLTYLQYDPNQFSKDAYHTLSL